MQSANSLEVVERDRNTHSLQLERPEVTKAEETRDESRRLGGEIHPARLGELLHSLRQPHGMSLRGVVHTEIVADLPDHHLARIESHANGEVEGGGAPELVRVAPELIAQVEGRVAGSPGVIFVRDGGPEQRHDSVAGVLVHCALEAVDAVGQNCEEPIHDLVPFLGIDLLGEVHRALYVSEEGGDLLPLTLERASRREDLLGEMLRGIGARIRRRSWLRGRSERLPALTAELDRRSVFEAAARALELQRRSALATKFYAARVFEAAG